VTPATYSVTLTVTDEIGQSSTSSPTTIAAGNPPAPTANFTFSPGLPGRFDNVVFDASSSTTAQGQTIVDVAWNFGDGTAVVHCGGVLFPNDPSCVNVGSTNRVSQHTFQTATTWQVNLVVTDSAGRTGSHPSPVTIALADPNVVITASPSTPTPGTQVNFNSDGTTYYSGSLPLAFPVSFSWTFGDGGSCSTANTLGCGTGTAADPNHIYLGVGTYGVGLSVTDNKGRTGVGNATVTVAAVVPPPPPVSPTASFTFGPTTVHAGVTSVLFDGSASKDSLGRSGPTATLTYVWNFGDGTPPTAPSAASTVNHTYAVLGPSSATLTVRDTVTGLSNTSAAQTVTVVP
jgi:PKD repeat protein